MPAAPDPFIARRMRAQRLSAPMAADPAAVVAWSGRCRRRSTSPPSGPSRSARRADRHPDRSRAGRRHDHPDARTAADVALHRASRRPLGATAVAPRVQLRSRTMYRTYEIDAALMTRARRIVEKALGGGQFLTRAAIGKALAAKGIEAAGTRLGLVVFVLELDAVICSGPRQGKQFTYALLEERVPRARTLSRDQARAELTRRFFLSHGPATVKDFAWWSGLTVTDSAPVSSPSRRRSARNRSATIPTGRPPPSRRRAAGRCRQSICCRSTTNTSSPTAIGSRRRRCSRRARRPIPWTATRTCCAWRGASAGSGDARSARGRLPCSSCPTGRSTPAPGCGQGGGRTLRRVPRPGAGVQRAADAVADTVKPQRAISA